MLNTIIKYAVSQDVHEALLQFFERLDKKTEQAVLSAPKNDVVFSEVEKEIKSELLFQFYLNRLLVAQELLNTFEKDETPVHKQGIDISMNSDVFLEELQHRLAKFSPREWSVIDGGLLAYTENAKNYAIDIFQKLGYKEMTVTELQSEGAVIYQIIF